MQRQINIRLIVIHTCWKYFSYLNAYFLHGGAPPRPVHSSLSLGCTVRNEEKVCLTSF